MTFIIEAKYDLRYEEVVSLIREDDLFDTMRVAEPDIFDYKWQPIIQFTKPTAMSRIRDSKHRYNHCFSTGSDGKEFSLDKMYFFPKKQSKLLKQRYNILQVRNSKVSKD